MSLTWQAHHDLSGANTLGLPCVAERFATPATPAELAAVLHEARAAGWPVTVLGGGSNLILGDWLPGLVVQPVFAAYRCETLDDESLRVHVDAGMNWHQLVMSLAEQGLWGIENLALIPGQCGAAPIQNIGAYGVELADVLERLHLVHLGDGREQVLEASDCAFGYRDSLFKRALDGRVVITRLELCLSTRPAPRLGYGDLASRVGPAPTPLEVAEAVCALRREKLPDPMVLANAGSFFKNPVVEAELAETLLRRHPDMPHFSQPGGRFKLAAGWLIDQCGLKGHRDGAFGVHDRQALVLVHHGGGNAEGLLRFADSIASRVLERFGVVLEREPRLVGISEPKGRQRGS
ncbi:MULTISPECIES: UDP-N-acetylmuramate dehydrogenase [Halomonadaceae]|uniref:UDP-N-acetylmuramate dehydrogenase n=1 Tax=Halomonadaceae TaxID=28256 RepID=UPI00158270AF|nr:UDP-N-acetylmuramate dehydrogenase [Halomonas sp. BMC7]MDI4637665.1 UDP-N-acetylmuramate dehydrogenase [Halomonas sp. BMC7]NUJ58684.1 UDP-N-acetylmuramate dehydrogenase [Halomonas taeanensis]